MTHLVPAIVIEAERLLVIFEKVLLCVAALGTAETRGNVKLCAVEVVGKAVDDSFGVACGQVPGVFHFLFESFVREFHQLGGGTEFNLAVLHLFEHLFTGISELLSDHHPAHRSAESLRDLSGSILLVFEVLDGEAFFVGGHFDAAHVLGQCDFLECGLALVADDMAGDFLEPDLLGCGKAAVACHEHVVEPEGRLVLRDGNRVQHAVRLDTCREVGHVGIVGADIARILDVVDVDGLHREGVPADGVFFHVMPYSLLLVLSSILWIRFSMLSIRRLPGNLSPCRLQNCLQECMLRPWGRTPQSMSFTSMFVHVLNVLTFFFTRRSFLVLGLVLRQAVERAEPAHLRLGVFECGVLEHVAFALLDDGEQVLDSPVVVLLPKLPGATVEAVSLEKAVEDGEVKIDSAAPHLELVVSAVPEILHDPLLEVRDSVDGVGGPAEGFLESFLALPVPPCHRAVGVEESLGNLGLGVKLAVKFHLVPVGIEPEGSEAQNFATRLVARGFDVDHKFVNHCAATP